MGKAENDLLKLRASYYAYKLIQASKEKFYTFKALWSSWSLREKMEYHHALSVRVFDMLRTWDKPEELEVPASDWKPPYEEEEE